ncbi:Bromodomain and PHD finger-containing protein 3 [Senna tora]|uniref:Bromodomain and PHD finger-containing protein 3 n=1 Tax=Senna tora TaxID=362788 RepID=A0A834T897_9FABA|nr:Bromodomain and PHD finger-containing protein 3 [Senna tora]
MSVGAGGFRPGPDNSGSPKNHISADSLYNPSREFHQQIPRIRGEFPHGGMPFQSDKNNFPFQALVPQPIHTGGIPQFPNRPMVFPQLAAADLSRFQMQSAWRGLSPHGQPKQKPETLPPDLNIGFQSPGSPAKQSSGVMVDSQQPDLALQL